MILAQATVCGAIDSTVVSISSAVLPLVWYEQNPRVARSEWFKLTDSRGAAAGDIHLWTCYYPDSTVLAPLASLAYVLR
jgi:hypothetical protein